MRLPRDLSGQDLVKRHYGYRVTRNTGSHMTATRITDDGRHSVTIPAHRELRLGTLDVIVAHVAAQLGVPKSNVRRTLFG